MGQSVHKLTKFVDNTELEGISEAWKDRIRIQKILKSWKNDVQK